jgi:hypothetical protein
MGGERAGREIEQHMRMKTMKTLRGRERRKPSMSPDAYAGFLKLWLRPTNELPAMTPEVEAYLRHAEKREPLPEAVRRVIGRPSRRAA